MLRIATCASFAFYDMEVLLKMRKGGGLLRAFTGGYSGTAH